MFPEVCEEINKLLQDEKQKLALLNGELHKKPVNNVILAINNGNGANGAQHVKSDECDNKRKSIINWPGLYSNLVIGISFSIFALVVNYVIKNLNQE